MNTNDKNSNLEVIFILEEIIDELGGIYGINDLSDIMKQINSYLNYIQGKSGSFIEQPYSKERLESLVNDERVKLILEQIVKIYFTYIKAYLKIEEQIYIHGLNKDGIGSEEQRAKILSTINTAFNNKNADHFRKILEEKPTTVDGYLKIIEGHLSTMDRYIKERVYPYIQELDKGIEGKSLNDEGKEKKKSIGKKRRENIGNFSEEIFSDFGDLLQDMDEKTKSIKNHEQEQSSRLLYEIRYRLCKRTMMEEINQLTAAYRVIDLQSPKYRFSHDKKGIKKEISKTKKDNISRKNSAKRRLKDIQSEYQEDISNMQRQIKKDKKENSRPVKKKRSERKKSDNEQSDHSGATDEWERAYREREEMQENFRMTPEIKDFLAKLYENEDLLEKFVSGKLDKTLTVEGAKNLKFFDDETHFSRDMKKMYESFDKHKSYVDDEYQKRIKDPEQAKYAEKLRNLELQYIEISKNIQIALHRIYVLDTQGISSYGRLLDYLKAYNATTQSELCNYHGRFSAAKVGIPPQDYTGASIDRLNTTKGIFDTMLNSDKLLYGNTTTPYDNKKEKQAEISQYISQKRRELNNIAEAINEQINNYSQDMHIKRIASLQALYRSVEDRPNGSKKSPNSSENPGGTDNR